MALITFPIQGEETTKNRAEARKDSIAIIDLRIEEEGWGNANPKDLSAVLHSSCSELAVHFGSDQLRHLEPIRIRHDKSGPITLYRRSVRGEILVLLNSKDRFWCQHAYQVAHEFGHILCRTRKADRSNLWFEESLCELASIFALRQMALTWKENPPYPNWRNYSKDLHKYADDLLVKYSLSDRVSLEEWYQLHAGDLQANPTNLPLFEKHPGHWEAVHYLNVGVNQDPKSFGEYLTAWHRNCPDQHKAFVAQISGKFGVRL